MQRDERKQQLNTTKMTACQLKFEKDAATDTTSSEQ